MAQTKTRASTKGARKTKSRSKPKSSGKAKARSTPSRSNDSAVKSARKAIESTAKDAGGTVGKAASKAKLPLVAGGAALAGAVGGLAVGTHQARRHKGLSGAMPQVKVSSRDVAGAARRVGTLGAQMGRLASELQQTREAAGNGRHRSPVEVVLEGLTARRSRS